MLPLGTVAPDFTLPDTIGHSISVSLSSFRDAKALLIMFLSNHCPFVKHVQKEIVLIASEYQTKGVAVIGISANDADAFPEDGPEAMAQEIRRAGYDFAYLYDETQKVAQTYRAACTPDFYVFDRDHRLVYRGQLDDSRPGNDVPVTGRDVRAAIDAVLAGKPVSPTQKPSLGCSIKWKPGNEPDYIGKL
jgi:peroxiredoxin